jgi:D-alanyl-D-alanine carboxypeptidase (penicillin-binding protein 5/6)
MSVPPLGVHRTLPASVVLAGDRSPIAWPKHGEAALEVAGMPPFGSSGPDTPVPIASLAKIMTAYVLLQDHPIVAGQTGFSLTINAADVAAYQSASAQQQSVVAVAQGETLNEVQVLEALLVASGNNISVSIADYDAGSVTAFVAKMNSTAKALGMNHTTYTDPSGAAATTVSNASDQLVLAGKAMAIPAFAEVVAMPSANLPVAGTVANFNKVVGTGGFVGVKTGSTAQAGGCVVFANRQTAGGRPILILGAVLGQDLGQTSTPVLTKAALDSASALVSSVVSEISRRTVLPAGSVVAVVSSRSGSRVNAVTTTDLTTVGLAGTEVPVTFQSRHLGTHIGPGDPAGTVSVPGTTDSVAVTVISALSAPGWAWRLTHLL